MSNNNCLMKNKQIHRERIARREEHKLDKQRGSPKVEVKQRRKFLKHHPISDAVFCDDLSYVPFRYIRGTLVVPGTNPGKGYVAQ